MAAAASLLKLQAALRRCAVCNGRTGDGRPPSWAGASWRRREFTSRHDVGLRHEAALSCLATLRHCPPARIRRGRSHEKVVAVDNRELAFAFVSAEVEHDLGREASQILYCIMNEQSNMRKASLKKQNKKTMSEFEVVVTAMDK